MKTLVETIDLYNRLTSSHEPADLFKEIDQKNLDDYEQQWKPEFERRLLELSSAGEVEAANLQDAHWQWSAKAKERAGSLGHESFAVECGGLTQGLMYVKKVAFARLQSQRGRDLVYVDLLSTVSIVIRKSPTFII